VRVAWPQPRQATVTQLMTIKNIYHFFYNTGNTKFEGLIDTLETIMYDFVGIRQSELYVQTTK